MRKDVELLPPEVAAKRDAVPSARPGGRQVQAVRAIPVKGAHPIRERGDATRKSQRGRPPVHGVLAGTGDSCIGRDVLAASKGRAYLRSQPAELKAEVNIELVVPHMRPVHVGVDAECVRLVQEVKQAVIVVADALKGKGAVDLVTAADLLVQP